MDLIYTNAKRVDQGVLSAYAFDLSFGAEENDFELTIGKSEAVLESGSAIYIEGTEYGGIVDGMKLSSNDERITYFGRTWHGILNSKVIEPDSGESYFTVVDNANEVLSTLIGRFQLKDLFSVAETSSVINVVYQFKRYCKGYDGIREMLAKHGAKLKIAWKDCSVCLSAVPIANYTDAPVDSDVAPITIERHTKKVNHLICLGRGELVDREVIHLYADETGSISGLQCFGGLSEVADVYDNSAVESSEELRAGGIARLTELRNTDKSEFSLQEDSSKTYDIGDIVCASDVQLGISVSSAVSQKIVRINNGAISIEYKTGG